MSEYTPGPWIAGGLAVRSNNGIICTCPTPQRGGTFDCSQNTTLIAAAPDLLEAAKLVYDCAFLDSRCTEDQWNKAVEAIETAIAKAEGVDPASTEPDLAGGNA